MSAPHRGQLVEAKNGYRVIHCEICGFAHLDPIPSRESLEAIYPREYYETEHPDWIEKTLSEKDYWMLTYRQRYEVLERLVRAGDRRVLDIGAFLGLFLEAGRERGWDTIGIEPSATAIRYARERGLHLLAGFLDDFDDATIGLVDVVNLDLTLEHVQDPADVLARAHRLLRPSGVLCVLVPNDFNPLQELLQERLGKPRYWIAPPHHINYFTSATLARLVERAGFQVVDRETTFPMEFFVLMGEDYIGDDQVGRRCHQKRMALEMHLIRGGLGSLKRELYRFLANWGVGREIVLYAQKRGR